VRPLLFALVLAACSTTKAVSKEDDKAAKTQRGTRIECKGKGIVVDDPAKCPK